MIIDHYVEIIKNMNLSSDTIKMFLNKYIDLNIGQKELIIALLIHLRDTVQQLQSFGYDLSEFKNKVSMQVDKLFERIAELEAQQEQMTETETTVTNNVNEQN